MELVILFLLMLQACYVWSDDVNLEKCLVPNTEILYYLKDMVYADGCDCYIDCDENTIEYQIRVNYTHMSFKKTIDLQGIKVRCYIFNKQKRLNFGRDFILHAYKFQATFIPKDRTLIFDGGAIVSCIPLPIAPFADYKNAALTLKDTSLVEETIIKRLNSTVIQFHKSSDLLYKTICLRCNCANNVKMSTTKYIFDETTCYNFTGDLELIYPKDKTFKVYNEEYIWKVAFYSAGENKNFTATCSFINMMGLTVTFESEFTLTSSMKTGNYTVTCVLKKERRYTKTVYMYVMSIVLIRVLPGGKNLNYSFDSLITCQLSATMEQHEKDLKITAIDLKPQFYTLPTKSSLKIKDIPELNGKKFCFECETPITTVDHCYNFIGYYSLQIHPDVSKIHFKSFIACYSYKRGMRFETENIETVKLDEGQMIRLANKSIYFNFHIGLHGRLVCVHCTGQALTIKRCYTLLGFLELRQRPNQDIFYVKFFTYSVSYVFHDMNASTDYLCDCKAISGPTRLTQVGGIFHLTSRLLRGNYTIECKIRWYKEKYILHIDDREIKAEIVPKAGKLSYMDNGLIECHTSEKPFRRFIKLTTNATRSSYKYLQNYQIQIFEQESLNNQTMCFICFANVTKLDEACYYLKYIVPLTIYPSGIYLNYTYQNKVSCDIEKEKEAFKPDVRLVANALRSQDDYVQINHTMILIKPNAGLNELTFCFNCSFPKLTIRKCFFFVGYYTYKIEPSANVIYYMRLTFITCHVFLKGVFHSVRKIVTDNEEEALRLSHMENDSAHFNFDFELHTKLVCVRCKFTKKEAPKCYRLYAFMKLTTIPMEEIYFVHYMNIIIQFAFINVNTSLSYPAKCIQSGGKTFLDRQKESFMLISKVLAGLYKFDCTMIGYNYRDVTTIEVDDKIQVAKISPASGVLLFFENNSVTCKSARKSFQKYLLITVDIMYQKYIKKISPTQLEIEKHVILRNKKVCFKCSVSSTALDTACYDMSCPYTFIYAPERKVYYLYRKDYNLSAQFFNTDTNESLSTHCDSGNNFISQVGNHLIVRSSTHNGKYEIHCSYDALNLKYTFDVVVVRLLVILKILPERSEVYTSDTNSIICQYDKSLAIIDTDLTFLIQYSDKNAYSKVSPIKYELVSNILYHNTTVCFDCALDNTAIASRCYLWKGFVRFHYHPNESIYFMYFVNLVKPYYVNLNDTSTKFFAECKTIVGTSKIEQDKDYNVKINTMTPGNYTVMCKMKDINQFDFMELKIDTPALSIFHSSLHKQVKNATHTLVFPGEVITFDMVYSKEFPSINYNWEHSLQITPITPSSEERLRKNTGLKINKNILTIHKGVQVGKDYLIKCVYPFKFKTLTTTINYTIGKAPTKIILNVSYYILFLDTITFDSDGYPPNLGYYDVVMNKTQILRNSTAQQVVIPTMRDIGIMRTQVTMTLKQRNYIKFGISRIKILSIRAFQEFNWNNIYKNTYYPWETLTCEKRIIASYTMVITQLSGPTIIEDIQVDTLVLENLLPGRYTIACVLNSHSVNRLFIRVKSFEVHSNSTQICFLPFAPVHGMLVKCVTSQYPILGHYYMNLMNVEKNSIVVARAASTLRIPYILPINKRFKLVCYYEINGNLHNITRTFAIQNASKVPPLHKMQKCATSESIPQENQNRLNNDYLVFKSQYIYYLKDEVRWAVTYNPLLLLIFTFLFLIFLLSLIMLRFFSHPDQFSYIDLYNDYMMRRHIIRKLNVFLVKNQKLKTIGIKM